MTPDALARRGALASLVDLLTGRARPDTNRLAVAAALQSHLDLAVEAHGDAPVFQRPQGGVVRHGAFWARVWKPALRDLGHPHAGLHVLRHSPAARMISAGASPKAVQSVLGHASAGFTLTVYGHLFDTDLDDLAARLDLPADYSRTKPVDLDAERAARTP